MSNILFEDISGIFLPNDRSDRFLPQGRGFLQGNPADSFLRAGGQSFLDKGTGFLPSSGRLSNALEFINELQSSDDDNDISDSEFIDERGYKEATEGFLGEQVMFGAQIPRAVKFKEGVPARTKRIIKKQFKTLRRDEIEKARLKAVKEGRFKERKKFSGLEKRTPVPPAKEEDPKIAEQQEALAQINSKQEGLRRGQRAAKEEGDQEKVVALREKMIALEDQKEQIRATLKKAGKLPRRLGRGKGRLKSGLSARKKKRDKPRPSEEPSPPVEPKKRPKRLKSTLTGRGRKRAPKRVASKPFDVSLSPIPRASGESEEKEFDLGPATKGPPERRVKKLGSTLDAKRARKKLGSSFVAPEKSDLASPLALETPAKKQKRLGSSVAITEQSAKKRHGLGLDIKTRPIGGLAVRQKLAFTRQTESPARQVFGRPVAKLTQDDLSPENMRKFTKHLTERDKRDDRFFRETHEFAQAFSANLQSRGGDLSEEFARNSEELTGLVKGMKGLRDEIGEAKSGEDHEGVRKSIAKWEKMNVEASNIKKDMVRLKKLMVNAQRIPKTFNWKDIRQIRHNEKIMADHEKTVESILASFSKLKEINPQAVSAAAKASKLPEEIEGVQKEVEGIMADLRAKWRNLPNQRDPTTAKAQLDELQKDFLRTTVQLDILRHGLKSVAARLLDNEVFEPEEIVARHLELAAKVKESLSQPDSSKKE